MNLNRKITNIKKEGRIYTVTFYPNLIEQIFGIKEKKKQYKDTSRIYVNGGGTVYVYKNKKILPNGSYIARAIDTWRIKNDKWYLTGNK